MLEKPEQRREYSFKRVLMPMFLRPCMFLRYGLETILPMQKNDVSRAASEPLKPCVTSRLCIFSPKTHMMPSAISAHQHRERIDPILTVSWIDRPLIIGSGSVQYPKSATNTSAVRKNTPCCLGADRWEAVSQRGELLAHASRRGSSPAMPGIAEFLGPCSPLLFPRGSANPQ